MTKFSGKVAWVTGASSGIGEALVFELSKLGAKVVISARREEILQEVKARCAQPENVMIMPLDLNNMKEFDAKVARVIEQYGQIDLLFNNGGISQRSMALDTPLEVDRRIMEIDYFGTIALTKAILPQMVKQKSGHIAVTTSLVGKFGSPWRSSYAAAKHALHGFFDSLRSELHEDNIKITLVCPGFIKTDVSVNALGADGKPTGEMDNAQANGMPASVCAQKIIKAVKNEELETVIGGKEKYGVLLKRFMPNLFAKIILKQNVR
ncbi:SDR family oxidoreductase [Marivirga sp. S37H4]|uniref:SDR family oxidoreductase n=1 Tax=Marivirga aurantiaca TaxID=2802615 RepID=A0A935CBW9_9BACT|nr:SDR family oxidoreductase [Marivirga aurantiaca]MBK6267042.1 SDR family oxidoreductase [Marivirga aurantiaca]